MSKTAADTLGWATVRVEDTGDGLIIHPDDAKKWRLIADHQYNGHFLPDGRYRIALTRTPTTADTGLVSSWKRIATEKRIWPQQPYALWLRVLAKKSADALEASEQRIEELELLNASKMVSYRDEQTAEQREAAAREQIAALTEAVLDAETWLEALVTDAAPGSEDSTHEVIKTITKLKTARALTLAKETNDGQ